MSRCFRFIGSTESVHDRANRHFPVLNRIALQYNRPQHASPPCCMCRYNIPAPGCPRLPRLRLTSACILLFRKQFACPHSSASRRHLVPTKVSCNKGVVRVCVCVSPQYDYINVSAPHALLGCSGFTLRT